MPRTASIDVTCPPGADLVVDVTDATKTVLASINAAGVGETEHLPNLDVSGRAYLRIWSTKKGAGGAYTVRVTLRDRQAGFELEPNDRRVDASPVIFGQAVSGFVAHGGDVDWYRFELPQTEAAEEPFDAGDVDAGEANDAGELTDAGAVDAGRVVEKRLPIRIDISPVDGVALDLQVMTEAEAVLFAAKSKRGAGISLRNVGAREADRVIYVVVKSAPVAREEPGSKPAPAFNTSTYYTLTVAPEEAGGSAELEPNDDSHKATDLPVNSYREGYLTPKGDLDCFRVTTDGPTIVNFDVTGVENVDLVLTMLNEAKNDEATLRANEGGTKEPERLTNVFCDKTCVVRVEPVARKDGKTWVREDSNAEQSYRLSVQVAPDDGSVERESNNTATTATPATFGKPIRGLIFPRKDVDFFQLDLRDKPVKTPIHATVIGILKVDVALYLHRLKDDGTTELVQTADGAKGDKPETVRATLEPGLYVFEVRDLKNREANFQDSYQLTIDEGAE